MSDTVQVFGVDNEDIKGSAYKRYKAKKGNVDRIGLVYTDPKAMFAGTQIHYKDRYFVCKKGYCCEKLGEPKWRVGGVMVKYYSDNLGNLKKPFSYEILPWVFSEQTYNKLRTADSEFPLVSHDIKISCTNEEYQNLDINSCRESVWQAKEEIKKQILEEAKSCWDWIKKNLGSDLSIEEIKDLINDGVSGSSSGADPTSNLDLDSVLNEV